MTSALAVPAPGSGCATGCGATAAPGRRRTTPAPGDSSSRSTSSDRAVRCPPVAPVPVHVLGRDELRRPHATLPAVRLDQRPVAGAVGPTTRSAAVRGVRDPAPVGSGRGSMTAPTAGSSRVSPARPRGPTAGRTARTPRRSPARSVAYATTPAAALAAALAPGALRRRQLLVAVEQHRSGRRAASRCGRHVVGPQRTRRCGDVPERRAQPNAIGPAQRRSRGEPLGPSAARGAVEVAGRARAYRPAGRTASGAGAGMTTSPERPLPRAGGPSHLARTRCSVAESVPDTPRLGRGEHGRPRLGPSAAAGPRPPDDETIGQGVTMAKYVAEGAHVTLVTCTLGEMGEVLVPDLEHLAAEQDGRAGPAPGRRAGRRDGGARRHRPPVPRRCRALP